MAMASSRPVTSTIWVGNLPFETTEADLQQKLAAAGPIKNLRLITDRETGRPKGFGFCEYFDKVTAESAFRNLNNSEFMGRTLRIDFAEEFTKPGGGRDREERGPGPQTGDRRGDGGDRGGGGRMIGFSAAQQAANQVSSMLGGAPASDRRIQDQLNELLASKSRPELWEVLRLLKEFLGGDRAAAKQYFSERPGLTKAVFQAQMLLGMVKPPPAGPGYGPPPPPPANFQEGPIGLGGRMAGGPMGLQGPPPPPMAQQQTVVMVDPVTGQQVIVPQQQIGGIPMQPPPQGMLQMQPPPPGQPLPMQQQPMGGPIPMQPIMDQGMQQQLGQMGMPIPMQQPPPPQQQVPQQPASGGVAAAYGGQDQAQMQALLRQVMTMTDEQINMLPEQFKQQVLYVKEQIRTGGVKLDI